MASSTPTPYSLGAASKTYETPPFTHRQTTHHPRNSRRFTSQKVSLAPPTSAAIPSARTKTNASTRPTANPLSRPNNFFPNLPPAAAAAASSSAKPASHPLSTDFSGKKSTRFVSKLHYNRPKSLICARHTSAAEEALQLTIELPGCDSGLQNLLFDYQFKLSGSDDYNFLLRELGNRGECSKAMHWYQFAVQRERRTNEKGKLASSMISILGRLGRAVLAKEVFDVAVREGYGNTVYSYSALISAYGRSGCCGEAVGVFEMMKNNGLKPNLVTYNAVIDACGKGGVDLNKVLDIFSEMLVNGVSPDRITFNSLLAVCSRGGLWESAMDLFNQMVYRGIDQDIFTYNTLLDAVCKGAQMDLAVGIMSDMASKNVMPNVVTYSTVIDGYAKAAKLDDALNLFNKMKLHGVALDRVSYNTLLSIYMRLGRFEEALNICREMERGGVRKDVVTYNALLGGFGKQGKYDQVKYVLEQMSSERVMPNLLTYSTLIDVYSKGGMHQEALQVFKEFKQAGMKADVVLYSALIDTLCKNGLVESAVSLLDEMTREGIKPNVVTYNTIIDALGRSAAGAYAASGSDATRGKNIENIGGDNSSIIQIFGQLATERSSVAKKFNCSKQELLCILGIFYRMHELEIKPNVVTFSAILNACSRCNSFEDASMLLEELRLFDDRVYGVAHGLLTGQNESIWVQALSLFDEVKQMDTSTASAFYNALTDVLWHFGQRHGAQLVVLEGKRRNVWENVWSEACLDLHLMSSGAARAMVHAWLLNIRSIVFEGHELPKLLSILTGWGKHSKVVGDGALRRVIEGLLTNIGAPFHIPKSNLGRFITTGTLVATWLKESGTLKLLILEDDRRTNLPSSHVQLQGSIQEQAACLQALPL